MRKNIGDFIRRYKFEYYLGGIIGDDLFDKMFGYLPPNIKFEDLKGDDLYEMWNNKNL